MSITKIWIPLFSVLFVSNISFADTVTRHTTYATNSQVTATNLNGNFDNIVNVVNGSISNDNIKTAAGVRLYEILGSEPSAATEGRQVYNTATDIVAYDTGSAWKYSPLYSGAAAQGEILYYSGSTWTRLGVGTSGQFLKTQGASANPTWDGATGTFKIITSTRAMDATDGNVSYTGVGFQPSAISMFAVVDAKSIAAWGYATATAGYVIGDNNGIATDTYAWTGGTGSSAYCIYLIEASNKTQLAYLATMDSDGFTLTWADGSQTAAAQTANLTFLCFK